MGEIVSTVTNRGADRLLSGHLWVYRADVLDAAGAEPGAIVRVQDRRRRYLGQALYSSKSQIALRLLARERRPFDRTFLADRIGAAERHRQTVAAGAGAFRLVASEGDLLPSLTVDRYGDCFVLQTLSQGMERLKPVIVEILQERFAPRTIVERNDSPVRALEDLPETKGVLTGEEVREVIAEDNGIRFAYDLLAGQSDGARERVKRA